MEKNDGGGLGEVGKAREGSGGDRQGGGRDDLQGQGTQSDAGRGLDCLETSQIENAVMMEFQEDADEDVERAVMQDGPPESGGDPKRGNQSELDGARKKMKVAADDEASSFTGTVEDQPGTLPAVSISGPRNPLFMVDVLEVLFKHILTQPVPADVARNVRSIRLVCKTWKDEVTRIYRRNRPSTVIDLVPDLEHDTIITSEEMEAFLDTMQASTMIPVQSYDFTFNLLEAEDQQLVKRFLQICGPEAVSLKLCCNTTHGGVDEYAEDDENSWMDLSDLKLVKLKTLNFELLMDDNISTLPGLLKLLLNGAQNLNEFTKSCSYFDLDDSQEEETMNVICTRLPATVKVLELDLFLPDSDSGKTFQQLVETGIKLAEFDCVFKGYRYRYGDNMMVDKPMLCKFLESQSATLRSLIVRDCQDRERGPSPNVLLEFPRMENLQHLNAIQIIPQPLSFAKTFPKLKNLDLWCWGKQDLLLALFQSVETDETKTASSVTKITMPYDLVKLPSPLLRQMSQCFPRITELELRIRSSKNRNETLPAVFTYFSNVERLQIKFACNGDADAVLSGVPVSNCKQIRRRPRNFDDVELEKVQQMPSILNLTKLKKLTLKKNRPYRVALTDFSAHFLFLRMPALKELCIQHSGVNFSARYKKLLEGRLKLTLGGDDEAGLGVF